MPTILSLDDDAAMLNLLRLILERAGFASLQTTSSRGALYILASQPVDLLTQDTLRPDMDGQAFYRLLKRDPGTRDIPVVFVTAHYDLDFAEFCRGVYGDGYLTKPFSPRELISEVSRVLIRDGKMVATDEQRALRRRLILNHYRHVMELMKRDQTCHQPSG